LFGWSPNQRTEDEEQRSADDSSAAIIKRAKGLCRSSRKPDRPG